MYDPSTITRLDFHRRGQGAGLTLAEGQLAQGLPRAGSYDGRPDDPASPVEGESGEPPGVALDDGAVQVGVLHGGPVGGGGDADGADLGVGKGHPGHHRVDAAAQPEDGVGGRDAAVDPGDVGELRVPGDVAGRPTRGLVVRPTATSSRSNPRCSPDSRTRFPSRTDRAWAPVSTVTPSTCRAASTTADVCGCSPGTGEGNDHPQHHLDLRLDVGAERAATACSSTSAAVITGGEPPGALSEFPL